MLIALRRASRLTAALVFAFSLLILLGWIFHLPLLTTFGHGWVGMSLPTALSAMLGAACLWLRARQPAPPLLQRLASLLAALLVLFAFWLLAGYIGDQPQAGFAFGVHYGRVSPATALCILLLGLMLLGMGRPVFGYVVSLLAAAGLVLCSLAFAAYAYNVAALYNVAVFSAMALPTASTFAVLFIAALLAEPFPGWMGYIVSRGSGGAMARRLLPAVVLVPFLFGWAVRYIDLDNPSFDADFGYALMAVVTAAMLTAIVCLVSASLSRRDIDIRQANQTLRNSEHAARAIIDTALDAFLQTDATGRITDWNHSAEALFGWTYAEVIGHKVEDTVMTPALRDEAVAARERFQTTGEITFLGHRLEREMVKRDGTVFPVEMAATALAQSDGLLFNLFIRDLTAKNATEAQLRQAQKMESIGTLTGGMAHDFNNILGVVIGNLDLLEDRLPDRPDIKEIIEDALAAALSGSELTQRLLAFARRQPLAPRAIDINTLIGDMGPLLRRALGETIAVQIEMAADLWPALADRAQLESAILNLCTNARDAMPQGGRLTLSTKNAELDPDYAAQHPDVMAGRYVCIEVTDTGTGMSPEVQQQIFEPFFTTKVQGKGTGLGLSMVFGFMRQSGGHVSVYSELGKGTTFRLYLPHPAASEPAPAVESKPAAAAAGGTETILVVEDNADVRQTVLRQLDSLGYRCLEAENADHALDILRDRHAEIDILFSDVVMPGTQNGLDLAWVTRERWPHIAILLTSGFPEARAREQDDRLSGFPLLSKPYRRNDLALALRQALESARHDASTVAGRT